MTGEDQWYFIASVNRRVRIQSASDDQFGYDLTTIPAKTAGQGDITVRDQPAFDEVLAGLGLIKLDAGRRFVNSLIRLTNFDAVVMSTKPNKQRLRRIDAPPLR